MSSIPGSQWIGLEVGDRFLDMGTGPGFPGVPLAIAFPRAEATLVESKEKVVRELGTFRPSNAWIRGSRRLPSDWKTWPEKQTTVRDMTVW